MLSKMAKGDKKSQEEQENVEVVKLQQIKEMFKQHEENIIKILAANSKDVNERITIRNHNTTNTNL